MGRTDDRRSPNSNALLSKSVLRSRCTSPGKLCGVLRAASTSSAHVSLADSDHVCLLRADSTGCPGVLRAGRASQKGETIRSTSCADEKTLVYSGLEDTMILAYHQIRDRLKRDKRMPNLRTAAFVEALDKVANTYPPLGVFP